MGWLEAFISDTITRLLPQAVPYRDAPVYRYYEIASLRPNQSSANGVIETCC